MNLELRYDSTLRLPSGNPQYRTRLLALLLLMAVTLSLVSCGGGGTPPAAGSAESSTTPASTYTLTLSIDKSSILANNTDSATATATLLDNKNVPLPGAAVTFSTTGGQISASSVTTDTNGEAKVIIKSGPIKSNQSINISAAATNAQTQSFPISINGTTLTISTDKTTIDIGGTSTLSVTLKDASNNPIASATVNFAITSGGEFITLSATSGTTNSSGQLSFTITGTSAGTAVVQSASLGAVASQTYIVASPAAAFGITSPSQKPYSLATNTELPITVSAPGVTTVQFFTSVGVWSNNGQNFYEVAVDNSAATAKLISTNAGTANVVVRDKANPSTKSDTIQVNISAPPSAAASLDLQSNISIVAPSGTGPSKNTATLEATVRAANGDVVGNAPVQFSITSPSGGGEDVSPTVVNTNDFGKAVTTFYSGASTDSDGVRITANIPGTAINDTIKIVVGGAAGSIVIGMGTKIIVPSTTIYSMPFSIQVSDANGNAVADAKVSLNIWPSYYMLGYRYKDSNGNYQIAYEIPAGYSCYSIPNEDTNKNLTLDSSEDVGPIVGPYSHSNRFLTGDGYLTPPNSAAGSVPATVTTGADGTATFNVTFLKEYSSWIEAQLTASVVVYGSETSTSYSFVLPYEEGQEKYLSNSPFGYFPNFTPAASAGATQTVAAGALVHLDGSGSFDADYDTLNYSWLITSKPGGSSATLSSAFIVNPTFTADIAGTYTIQLIVDDGIVSSTAATVTITAN